MRILSSEKVMLINFLSEPVLFFTLTKYFRWQWLCYFLVMRFGMMQFRCDLALVNSKSKIHRLEMRLTWMERQIRQHMYQATHYWYRCRIRIRPRTCKLLIILMIWKTKGPQMVQLLINSGPILVICKVKFFGSSFSRHDGKQIGPCCFSIIDM